MALSGSQDPSSSHLWEEGRIRMEQVRVEQKKNPRDDAGFFSIVFFWWMNPLLALGYSRDLELEDLFEPRKEDASEVNIIDEDNY